MRTPEKKTKAKDEALAALRLTCTSFGDHSEIEAFIEASGTWETIATTHPVAGFDAEDIAHAIIRGLKHESQK